MGNLTAGEIAQARRDVARAERALSLAVGSVERDVFLVLVRELYAAELARKVGGPPTKIPPLDWSDAGWRSAAFLRLADTARDAAMAFRSRIAEAP